MKTYGILNDTDIGDKLSNILNATKSSMARTDGKGAHRNSKLKRKIRTSMNKRKRSILKRELFYELINIHL